MPCLVLGLAWRIAETGSWYLAYLAGLLAIEAASFFWTRQLNGPFVNFQAGANSSYRIDTSARSVWTTYQFYLEHLLNPFLVSLVVVALLWFWRTGRTFGTALSFLVAGFATFATHALLPNHRFEEYSWLAAPLILAPVVILAGRLVAVRPNWAALLGSVLICALTVLAVSMYAGEYQRKELRWMVDQDRTARNVAASLGRLQQISPPSRILVTGLDLAFHPWLVESFIRDQFDAQISWTVVAGPSADQRTSNRSVQVSPATEVRLGDFDQLVIFAKDGRLKGILPVAQIPADRRRNPLVLLVPGFGETTGRADSHRKTCRCSSERPRCALIGRSGRKRGGTSRGRRKLAAGSIRPCIA